MLRRKAVSLTQQQIADAVGVTARTVQRWEGGETIPVLDPYQVWQLCTLLRCSVEDLARDFFPDRFPEAGAISAESPGDYSPN